MGTDIQVTASLSIVGLMESGGSLPLHVFAMVHGDLGDLGPPAPRIVVEEHSHVVDPVTTQPPMEENSVPEVDHPANLAIRSAVQLMQSGVIGVHFLPAKMVFLHVDGVDDREQEVA